MVSNISGNRYNPTFNYDGSNNDIIVYRDGKTW